MLVSSFFFDTFTFRARNLRNLRKHLCFARNFNDFTILENMFKNDFHGLFRYLFWHGFFMNIGIDWGSILAPLWHQLLYFSLTVFLYVLGFIVWSILNPNRDPFGYPSGIKLHVFGCLFCWWFVGCFFDRFGSNMHTFLVSFLVPSWSFGIYSLVHLKIQSDGDHHRGGTR